MAVARVEIDTCVSFADNLRRASCSKPPDRTCWASSKIISEKRARPFFKENQHKIIFNVYSIFVAWTCPGGGGPIAVCAPVAFDHDRHQCFVAT